VFPVRYGQTYRVVEFQINKTIDIVQIVVVVELFLLPEAEVRCLFKSGIKYV
jgi:hypothetical protein